MTDDKQNQKNAVKNKKTNTEETIAGAKQDADHKPSNHGTTIENKEKHNIEEATENSQISDAVEGEAMQKLAELEKQLVKEKDQALRALAEAENVRRRSRMDIEKAHKYGNEKLINLLLPVIDSLWFLSIVTLNF